MPDNNVTRFPGRRDRALSVLAAIQVTLADARQALPSADYIDQVEHDARQARALYEGDADSGELLAAIDAAMAALSALARLGESCDAAMKPLGALMFHLASTPDDPPAS